MPSSSASTMPSPSGRAPVADTAVRQDGLLSETLGSQSRGAPSEMNFRRPRQSDTNSPPSSLRNAMRLSVGWVGFWRGARGRARAPREAEPGVEGLLRTRTCRLGRPPGIWPPPRTRSLCCPCASPSWAWAARPGEGSLPARAPQEGLRRPRTEPPADATWHLQRSQERKRSSFCEGAAASANRQQRYGVQMQKPRTDRKGRETRNTTHGHHRRPTPPDLQRQSSQASFATRQPAVKPNCAGPWEFLWQPWYKNAAGFPVPH